MPNEGQLSILRQGVGTWNQWRQEHPQIRIDLKEANLSGGNLSGANLEGASLTGARFIFANLTGADLNEAQLTGAKLEGANLSGANLRRTRLLETCLINANINGAMLTDACLWETQRAGWSIQGVICEAVYWDRNGHEQTIYSPGEFERLYADKTKIVLHYEGGISPIEVATLPALIQRMEATHAGCVLRLDSVQNAAGGATVTLVVEEGGGQTSADLQDALQEQAKQLQAMQRYALEQGQMREALAHEFSQFKERVAPLLLEKVEQRRSVEEREAYLTVLFLDMRGFARLEEEERKEHLDILRGLAQPLLQRRAAQYVNTWGDAIVACFEDANAGLKCACEIVTVLQAARIQSRIGMSRGKTLVRHNPLTGRPDIEGESVNLAARLEPLAELGGVLIDKDLRYHPEVTQDRFIFVRLQRSLEKAVGDQQKGQVIECYSVEFRGKSQK